MHPCTHGYLRRYADATSRKSGLRTHERPLCIAIRSALKNTKEKLPAKTRQAVPADASWAGAAEARAGDLGRSELSRDKHGAGALTQPTTARACGELNQNARIRNEYPACPNLGRAWILIYAGSRQLGSAEPRTQAAHSLKLRLQPGSPPSGSWPRPVCGPPLLVPMRD